MWHYHQVEVLQAELKLNQTNPFANRKRYNENDSSSSNNSHSRSNRFYPERSSDQSRDPSKNTGGFAAHNPRPNGFMTRSIPRESASSGMLPNCHKGRSSSTASSHYPFSQKSNSSGHYSSFSKPSHSTSLNIPSHGHVEDLDGFLASILKAEFLSEIKESFCNEHPRVDFCPTQSTLPPVPQQLVVQAPPPLTPEQIQQQQQFLKMQKIISEITTPSGFIGENPGITIGLVVILISGFCFFAALGLSFLTGKKPKPAVAPNRGRRGNQMRKPSKPRNPQRKEKTSSSVNDMENGSKRKDETKEKDEKQKSTNSKSKKNSKESIDSTS
ncbi:unnamed protein product [Caenorhabditis brenneri]